MAVIFLAERHIRARGDEQKIRRGLQIVPMELHVAGVLVSGYGQFANFGSSVGSKKATPGLQPRG